MDGAMERGLNKTGLTGNILTEGKRASHQGVIAQV